MPSVLKVLPARAALIVAIAVLLAGCEPAPVVTQTSPPTVPGVTATPSSAPATVPFEPSAWPAGGSACDTPGYGGLLGRIEASAARTVQFTLCRPDAAFPSRLAHPSLGILDTATIDRLAQDRASASMLAGAGAYRIAEWTPSDNVRLERVGEDPTPDAMVSTIILRWAADPAARTNALQEAEVDAIDNPGAAQLDRIATLPELTVVPRDGLAMAYLAFGSGSAFNRVAVRRAIAGSLDRDSLVAATFPAGSVAATRTVPCAIPDACAGEPWYEFNGPAAAAELADAGFDLETTYPLHIPDAPIPGLPNPAEVAAAIQAQLAANVGMTVAIDTMPAADLAARARDGSLDGLYLDGLASPVADAGAFLAPLFGAGATDTPADRAPSVADDLATAAASTDAAGRSAAFTHASDTIRNRAPIVPLGDPGSVAVFRSDVGGAAAAPLGLDPLWATTPGDRNQTVFMQATEPRGAYCGDQATDDAYRLCALVTPGLYRLDPATLIAEPSLAQRCTSNADATVWTCRLRSGVTFTDGAKLDAGDVLSSYVAQWDRSQPLREADPASFSAWDALFGGSLGHG